MPDRWKVLLPKSIDPSGPDSIADFADCTGMDEYDSDDDALADIEVAAERGIVVCNTPGRTPSPSRNTPSPRCSHSDGISTPPTDTSGRELTNDTLGLYGFRNIAQKTAAMAMGMGMRAERFEGLFERSDAVSVHVPLTDQTHHSISTAELSALGEHGVVVNTARGAVIDEAALVDALETGTVGGAALDTFESEPPGEDHPLYGRDNVLLTPHIGGVTTQALARMSRQAAATVRTVYEGGSPTRRATRRRCRGRMANED